MRTVLLIFLENEKKGRKVLIVRFVELCDQSHELNSKRTDLSTTAG